MSETELKTEIKQLKKQIEDFINREKVYQELIDMLTACITDMTKNDFNSAQIRIGRITVKINELKNSLLL